MPGALTSLREREGPREERRGGGEKRVWFDGQGGEWSMCLPGWCQWVVGGESGRGRDAGNSGQGLSRLLRSQITTGEDRGETVGRVGVENLNLKSEELLVLLLCECRAGALCSVCTPDRSHG